MNNPLLSIVIPVYNGEETLHRAVDSVFIQPCANMIELLLVDDGSIDNSGVICDKIASNNSFLAVVRVFHQKNGGVLPVRY